VETSLVRSTNYCCSDVERNSNINLISIFNCIHIRRIVTSPFPNRAPELGSTATDPITIKSTLRLSSKPIGLPYLAAPTEVHASGMHPTGIIWESITEKNPVLSRGWGVNSFLSPGWQEVAPSQNGEANNSFSNAQARSLTWLQWLSLIDWVHVKHNSHRVVVKKEHLIKSWKM